VNKVQLFIILYELIFSINFRLKQLIHFLVHLVNPSSLGIKRTNRPLMIDSHSTASLVNIEDDDPINDLENADVDEDEEDEEFVNINASHLESSINKGNGVSLNYKTNLNANNQRKFQHQQLVELEDDDERKTDNIEKRKGSYITEIETININKTNSNRNINENNIDVIGNTKTRIPSTELETSYSPPLSKKFKKLDTVEINNLPITSENNKNNLQQSNYLYTNNTLDLKVNFCPYFYNYFINWILIS